MKKKQIIKFFIFFIGIIVVSCQKEEGKGGQATIKGEVIIKEYNKNFTRILNTYPAPEADIYIIYGDDEIFGDRTRTHYDGTYEFKYLKTGDYTVYVYSDDTTKISGNKNIPVSTDIHIKDRKQTVRVEDIYIAKALDYNDGNSSISGKVYEVVYDVTFSIILNEYFVPDEWVFIVHEDDISYFDRVLTMPDGSFKFEDLIPGNYKVFAYSDDSTYTVLSGKVAVEENVEITKNDQHLTLPTLRILKN